MRLEEAQASNLMGCQSAFALFSPAEGGYLEAISSWNLNLGAPISRAKLFESAMAAKKYASSKKLRAELSVVEVSVRALRAFEMVENANHDSLMAAIARAEALELDNLIKDQETERLRERLAQLEAERGACAPSGIRWL